MSTYMPNLELDHKGKNTEGGEFDPVLWIGLRRSSMVRALVNCRKTGLNLISDANKASLMKQLSQELMRKRPHAKKRLHRPVTVTNNDNHGRLLTQVLQFLKRNLQRTALKIGISTTSIRRMFKGLG
ncbi:hypothetical protein ANN_08456 [Periplaneta americana]|uniref:Uncharacterized protein n=1 Tax=Periplaneta americana TaxID=6978 RepID=A0ABQ8T2Z6_PERAM|nr:hypothetical protein ANN_08456 [Periplaneta americana]